MKKIEQAVHAAMAQQISDLCALIRIPSIAQISSDTHTYGPAVTQALDTVLQIAERLGLNTVRIGDTGGFAEWGAGPRVVAAFTHLDVVPPGEGWSFPAFDGAVRNGAVWGRGSVDNKGPAIGCLYALRALRAAGIQPTCTLRVYFGGCEETGMLDLPFYLERYGHPDAGFVPDSQFPLAYAEKGVLFLALEAQLSSGSAAHPRIERLDGGNMRNTVPAQAQADLSFPSREACAQARALLLEYARQKAYDLLADCTAQRLHCEMTGLTAHANAPEFGKNAILQLLDCLHVLHLPGEDGNLIETLLAKIGFETDGASLGIACGTPYGALVQNLSTMQWHDGALHIVFNVRYPYGCDSRAIVDSIQSALTPSGFRVRIQDALPPVYIPPEHPAVRLLQRVYQQQTGDCSPIRAAGATYAKYVRNVVPFGAIFPNTVDYCHQADEHVSLHEISLHTRIYALAFYELMNFITS